MGDVSRTEMSLCFYMVAGIRRVKKCCDERFALPLKEVF
jgi:hypothetical protein